MGIRTELSVRKTLTHSSARRASCVSLASVAGGRMTGNTRVWTRLALVGFLCAARLAAQERPPALMQISGVLTDQQGKALSDVQTVTFALYRDQAGSAPLWLETQTVVAN